MAGGSTAGGASAGGATSGGSTAGGSTAGGGVFPSSVTVTLTRAAGVTGTQRVNLAVPFPDRTSAGVTAIAARVGGNLVPTSSRILARSPLGGARSIQVQFDVPAGTTSAVLELAMSAPQLTEVAVDTLLQDEALGTATVRTPRVWATLPSSWLVFSDVGGHLVENALLTTAPLNAWRTDCNYTTNGSAAFASQLGTAGPWLYDRGTALFRGYVVSGDLSALQSAYRETDLYRQRILASSSVPPSSDLKYNYTQNLALHYLLTGDDRFREAAETVAARAPVSGYTGAISTGFWTERHAGFGLLANVFAARVSDDQAATFRARADTIVTNLIAIQDTPLNLANVMPASKNLDSMSRCFAHTPQAHDLSEYVNLDGATPATLVCSPWMSAIVADGLEAYADDAPAGRRTAALNAIVRLGRRLANADNRNPMGRPHYLLGVDGANAPDPYEEHWGEVAYVAAMAWHYSGRTDQALRANAMHYVTGFSANGTISQLRSFNWQCRSAVATPFYLR
jgi:hypothetical protein